MEPRVEGVGEGRAGLVSLGLIMQLVGSIVAAYLIARWLEAALPLLFGQAGWLYFSNFYDDSYHGPYDPAAVVAARWHLPLLATLGLVRALLHRRAGGAILYRRGGLRALYAYVAAALVHTGLCLTIFHLDSTGPTQQWSIVALLGAVWPLCLLVAATRPSFRRAVRAGPAATDDTAPDELASLTIFLGLVGAMVAIFAVHAAFESYDPYRSMATSAKVPAAIGVLLLVRALMQLRTGSRVAGRAPDAAGSLATAGYVRIGLIASALAIGALAISLGGLLQLPHYWGGQKWFTERLASELANHALAAYLIVLWPLLLRRFLLARKTSTTVSAGESPRSGAALAALGWFLLAAGGLQIAFALLALIAGPRGTSIVWDWADRYLWIVGVAPRSAWLQLLVVIPQLWTALEVLGATRRRRAAATAYAACASVAIALSIWGDIEYLVRLIGTGLDHPTALVAYLHFAFPLIVPIATLVFVQHHLRRLPPQPNRPADTESSFGVPVEDPPPIARPEC